MSNLYNAGARFAGSSSRARTFDSPDWSRGKIVGESDNAHAVSKFLGGNGIFIVATAGTGELLQVGSTTARVTAVANTSLAAAGGTTNALNSASDFREGKKLQGSAEAGFAVLDFVGAFLGVRGMRKAAAPTSEVPTTVEPNPAAPGGAAPKTASATAETAGGSSAGASQAGGETTNNAGPAGTAADAPLKTAPSSLETPAANPEAPETTANAAQGTTPARQPGPADPGAGQPQAQPTTGGDAPAAKPGAGNAASDDGASSGTGGKSDAGVSDTVGQNQAPQTPKAPTSDAPNPPVRPSGPHDNEYPPMDPSGRGVSVNLGGGGRFGITVETDVPTPRIASGEGILEPVTSGGPSEAAGAEVDANTPSQRRAGGGYMKPEATVEPTGSDTGAAEGGSNKPAVPPEAATPQAASGTPGTETGGGAAGPTNATKPPEAPGVKPTEAPAAKNAEAPTRVRQDIYITDKSGKDIGQADVWEVDSSGKRTFIEEKSGMDIGKINERTGKPYGDPAKQLEAFGEKQIYKAGVKKATAIQEGVGTRGDAGKSVPSIEEIRTANTIRFEIQADTPELRATTERQLQRLRQDFPKLNFEVRYGVKPEGTK